MLAETNGLEKRIPVTIVTGFLGAGKTTLLQRIIRESVGKKIAIIQNEVSEEMGIESAVLTDSSGNIIPDFFELPNGCICCTSKDDMIITLENIVNLGKQRIDAIIVETTGIADPCSVAEIFWLDNELNSFIYLDGIVAVVDCLNFPSIIQDKHILEHAEIGRKQVAIADRILINKIDLVDGKTNKVTELIKSLNPTADVRTTSQSSISSPEWVLDIGTFDPNKLRVIGHTCDVSSHQCVDHLTSSVDHVFFKLMMTFEKQKLERVIGDILWQESHDCGSLYRAKGLVRFVDGWYSLQAVGALFEVLPITMDQVEDSVMSKFLFIGSRLNEQEIRGVIETAVFTPSS
jgi:G3E family GTPase